MHYILPQVSRFLSVNVRSSHGQLVVPLVLGLWFAIFIFDFEQYHRHHVDSGVSHVPEPYSFNTFGIPLRYDLVDNTAR